MADETFKTVKRLKYFTGQFLEAEDFTAEQEYHMDMRRRKNKVLYTAGILDGGFCVEIAEENGVQNPRKISIGAGVGVDAEGRELVIITPIKKDLPTFKEGKLVYYATLPYLESEGDIRTAEDGIYGATRWVETPDVDWVDQTAFDGIDTGQQIILAKITLEGTSGNISAIDMSVRTLAKLHLVGKVDPREEFREPFGNSNLWGQFIKLGAERMWGLQNSYGTLYNWNTDSLFIGLKDEGPDRKDAVIAFGDNPDDSLRFLFTEPPTTSETSPPAPVEHMRITGDGRIGIGTGTAGPETRLHIEGARGLKVSSMEDGTGNDWISGNYGGITGDRVVIGLLHGKATIGAHSHDLGAWTDLTINPDGGNVGIGGTASPSAKLEVVGGNLKIGSLQLGGFTDADQDEWPNVVWYRDPSKNWDEGLIKHSSGRGKFGRAGFGIHFHQSREFGLWSTEWDPLFAVEGGTGNTYIKGSLTIGGGSIGTTDPQAKLHLSFPDGFGNIKLFSPSSPLADFGYDGGSDNIFWFSHCGLASGTTNFRWDGGNRDLLVLKNSGDVSIPSGKLEVSGASFLQGGATIANGLTVSSGASSLQGGATIEKGLTVNGFISLQGAANPDSSEGFWNQITPKNLIKAWGVISYSSGQEPNILDGFNISSVKFDGSNLKITLPSILSNFKCIVVTGHCPGYTYHVTYVDFDPSDSFHILVYKGDVEQDLRIQGGRISFIVLGCQVVPTMPNSQLHMTDHTLSIPLHTEMHQLEMARHQETLPPDLPN